MYYRVAIQRDPSAPWQWKSTMLSSLEAVFRLLRLYQPIPQDRLLVCSSPSREQLVQRPPHARDGWESSAVTAAQFLQERLIHPLVGTQSTSTWGMRERQKTISLAVAKQASLTESNLTAIAEDETSGNALEQRRKAIEDGAGGDHDAPYAFALPRSLPHVLAWAWLLARVKRGEIQP